MADAARPAQSASGAVLIYTTFPSESEAKKAARALVEAGLVACANIFPQMTAVYSWEGKVEEGAEAAMILKTVQGRLDEALAELKRLHPYSTPARLALPVSGGGEDFLSWIAAQCGMPQG
jgi:periplasmic divalent cation tolerance protein